VSVRARSAQYFSATVVGAVVSFITLPLTTKVLGPKSYGILALGSTLAGVGAFVATLGMTFVLSSRWMAAERDERRRIVGTLLTIGFVIVAVWAALVAIGYIALRSHVAFLGTLSWGEMALALGGLLLSPTWTVATDVVTVEGNAGFFAAATIAQSLATAGATLIALFVFHAGTLSLFVGVFAAGAVSFAASLWYLRDYLGLHYDRQMRGEMAQSTFALAQVAETVQALVERVLLSRFVGFVNLGLFVHARRYRDLANQATGSVTRGVWPVSLDEARDLDGSFPRTARTWRAVYILLTASGIAATALGDRFISLLTHGKFTHAWIYLTPWFVLLLVQLSAKPEIGTIYAFGEARMMGRISLGSNVVALALTAALIPWLGTGGALIALFVQALYYRIAVRLPARRLRRIPFQDAWAIAGCLVLLALYATKLLVGRGITTEVAIFVVAETAWLGAAVFLAGDVFSLVSIRRASSVVDQEPPDAPPDEVELEAALTRATAASE
jgi:O-antigen/teichoic acid export membrane protein